MPNTNTPLSRRGFFSHAGSGVYGAALAWLLNRDLVNGSGLLAAESTGHDLRPRQAHFQPQATSVIQLFMQGGPSQMDLFDPKPKLDELHGRSYFEQVAADLTGPEDAGALMRSPFKFRHHGESGIPVSELLPHTSRVVDDIAVIRSMFTTHFNHEPAIFKYQSGRLIQGLPSIGSWIVYGLGSENQNLPAYVALSHPSGKLPVNGVQNWQAGLLPPIYQGTQFRSSGSPLLNLRREVEQPPNVLQYERDLLNRLDRIHRNKRPGQLQLDARLASYQLAARMQVEATDALDLAQETAATHKMYGLDQPKTGNFGRRCLIARRLIERGVRFIQICTERQIWDNHSKLVSGLADCCRRTDQPVAGLLKDLKQRGMLDSTLILWGGEFGRMPIAQLHSSTVGRDHNPRGFTVWLAGGGVKGGTIYGSTDELGYQAEANPVSVTDLHATILHLLGLYHDELVFDHNGLEEKLTSVFKAKIVRDILA